MAAEKEPRELFGGAILVELPRGFIDARWVRALITYYHSAEGDGEGKVMVWLTFPSDGLTILHSNLFVATSDRCLTIKRCLYATTLTSA